MRSFGLRRTAAMMTGLMSGCVMKPIGSLRGLGIGVDSTPSRDRIPSMSPSGWIVVAVVDAAPAVVVITDAVVEVACPVESPEVVVSGEVIEVAVGVAVVAVASVIASVGV